MTKDESKSVKNCIICPILRVFLVAIVIDVFFLSVFCHRQTDRKPNMHHSRAQNDLVHIP